MARRLGREHRAGDDQRKADSEPKREGFAQQGNTEDEGNRGVDVGDDGRANGSDLADQREEHDEPGQGRNKRKAHERRAHLQREAGGEVGNRKWSVGDSHDR